MRDDITDINRRGQHASARRKPKHRKAGRAAALPSGPDGATIQYLWPADRAAAAASTSPHIARAAQAIGDATTRVAARYSEGCWRIAATLTTPDGFALIAHLTSRNFRTPATVTPITDEAPYRVWLPGSLRDIHCRTLPEAIITLTRLRCQRSLAVAAVPGPSTRPDALIVGAPIRDALTGRAGEIVAAESACNPVAVLWADTGATAYVIPGAIGPR